MAKALKKDKNEKGTNKESKTGLKPVSKKNSSKSVQVVLEKDLKNVLKATLKAGSSSSLLKLKNFEEIKRDYELTEDSMTPTAAMHKMSEIIEFYLKMIQQILQPEEFHAVYECTAFHDADKIEIFSLYKRLIIDHRELLKAIVMNDENNSVSTVEFVHEEIKSVKPQMLDIINKMQDSWKKEGMTKGPKQYFG